MCETLCDNKKKRVRLYSGKCVGFGDSRVTEEASASYPNQHVPNKLNQSNSMKPIKFDESPE